MRPPRDIEQVGDVFGGRPSGTWGRKRSKSLTTLQHVSKVSSAKLKVSADVVDHVEFKTPDAADTVVVYEFNEHLSGHVGSRPTTAFAINGGLFGIVRRGR